MASHRTGETRVVGTTVGDRYTIEELIGRGGMATVYRARDEILGRSVALKMFAAGIDDAQDLQRKSSEIRLLAALNHPALVTLYDAHDGGDDTGGAGLHGHGARRGSEPVRAARHRPGRSQRRRRDGRRSR
ncbi:hypothetical protein NB037_08250 [Rathayibacter sp. ZW T2_19]|uniref:non-specific serine/threonine protein kinase n=1 Tax=Rathayibacter rubneri TaxID=2950106 RepID=A0A9X2DZ67_9MICO|nr:hypothetical protein [Rathayibacter rubneri]MCM6762408.1 hypothetical protein [Rathayibacter rubneri]